MDGRHGFERKLRDLLVEGTHALTTFLRKLNLFARYNASVAAWWRADCVSNSSFAACRRAS